MIKQININQLLKRLAYLVLAFILITSTFVISNPCRAYAYNTPKALVWKNSIVGNINTDGSITVSETKIIDITKYVEKGKSVTTSNTNNSSQNDTSSTKYFNPIVWGFNNFPKNADVDVENIKIAICGDDDKPLGNWETINGTTFLSKWSSNNGPNTNCYAYDSESKQILCYLDYFNSNQIKSQDSYNKLASMTGIVDNTQWKFNKAIVSINYTINAAPVVYKDVADFDWVYISDTWQEDSYDVDMTVYVPVGQTSVSSPFNKNSDAASSSVDRNIFAWGHGSSGGILDFDDSGIIRLSNDKVPGGTDAAIRIVFPSSWLTNLNPNCDLTHSNQTKLATILKSESVWKDSKTNEVKQYILPIVITAICITIITLSIVLALISKKKYASAIISKEDFEKMHPCIKVRLKNWNREHPHDMIASLLHLNEMRIIKIHKLASGDFKIEAIDRDKIAKEMTASYENSTIEKTDIRTLRFLFGTCATGKTWIRLQEIESFANSRPKDFLDGYNVWHQLLTDNVAEICQFRHIYDHFRHITFGTAFLLALTSTIFGIVFMSFTTIFIGIISGIVTAMIANTMRNKIYFKDDNGNLIDGMDIPISFKNYTEAIEEFRNSLNILLDSTYNLAHDKIRYIN